jgi:ketosteroid isomerase-like protein
MKTLMEFISVITRGYTPAARLFAVVLLFILSNSSMAGQNNGLETAKAFIAALSDLNADKALMLLSDEAVLEMPYPLASGENKYGTQRMWGDPLHKYVKGITQRNSSIAFENAVWRVADDGVLILECDGDMVRAKDGARYQNRYIVLFAVTNGKITLWREYFNPVVAARAFGIPLDSPPY